MKTPAWIIQKKRDGKELESLEILDFIQGITDGRVADYQASAFLMAVYFRGMTLKETVALTEAMLGSGERYNLSKIPGVKVDKHSTGGVGDKVSLILAPLAAACGLKVPMMSGRGLGHSGGTVDKLESIPCFNINLTRDQFTETLSKVGCAMTSQTSQICPADKKLYALRDVTATVECIPLIVASILSKKIAEGAEALVLDVKVGNGAFMKSRKQAQTLAKTLIQVAKVMGLPARAVLTNMDQPLGYAAGNSIEVKESIEILKNQKQSELCSADLKELTVQLCAQMLELGKVTRTLAEGRRLAHSKLADGSAWKVFQSLVRQQGGNLEAIENPQTIPLAKQKKVWLAKKSGYVVKMDTEALGRALIELGGGRKFASDSVDPTVGLIFHHKLGNKIKAGEPIFTLYGRENASLEPILEETARSIVISAAKKPVPKLIIEQIKG
jgi:pyrimidine-nucleoside phosphorylase